MTLLPRLRRPVVGVIAVAIACTVLTACGSDKRAASTTTTVATTPRTTTTATTQAPANDASRGLPLGGTQQLTGSENGGYSGAVAVTRVWRSSANRINAQVVFDVARGSVPSSKRWTLVDRSQRVHVGSVDATSITGHREATITFNTPSNTSPAYIRFGDTPGVPGWAVPALARYTPRTTTRTTTKTRVAKTTTKTRTKSTTRSRRTTSHH